MRIRYGLSFLIALLLVVAVGCTKEPTRVDMFSGTAFELAKENQINNPDAGIHTGSPVGLEGTVASKVINRYEKGFDKAAPKTEVYTLSISK